MILVTGGAGFIGRRVTRQLLDAGHPVRVLDDLSGGGRPVDGAEFVRGDVTDPACVKRAMRGVTAVAHLAAVASVPAGEAFPARAARVNVTGTAIVAEAAAAAGAALAFASSAAVYPDSSEPAREDTPPAAASVYAATKLTGEALTLAVPRGTVLRLFNVYDAREGAGVIARWTAAAENRDPLPLHGDGRQTRDYVHVDDAAQVITTAVTNLLPAKVLNVCTGRAATLLEVLDAIARHHPHLVVERRPRKRSDVNASVGDPSLLQRLLPDLRLRSLEEGLA